MKKVLAFGTFDGLHPGHIDFFEQAKKLGGRLIVVVGRDVTVNKVKGAFPKRSELLRLKAVEQCNLVDQAMLGNIGDPYAIIEKINPDIVALGYDQRAFTENLADFIKKSGLKTEVIRFKPYAPEIYHSSIIGAAK